MFSHPGPSVLDASGDANGVVLYGGAGNVTIHGGGGDDQIAGGSGTDVIWAGTGNDDIYGNGGFNSTCRSALPRASTRSLQVLEVVNVAGAAVLPARDPLTASSQTLHRGSGNDVIFAHWGVISVSQGTSRLISTAGVTGVVTADGAGVDGCGDRRWWWAYLVLGGAGNNLIDLRASSVEPDSSSATTAPSRSPERRACWRTGDWFSALSAASSRNPLVSGEDTLLLGSAPAIVIGGAGNNYIQTLGGNDIIFGNDGLISFSAGSPRSRRARTRRSMRTIRLPGTRSSPDPGIPRSSADRGTTASGWERATAS